LITNYGTSNLHKNSSDLASHFGRPVVPLEYLVWRFSLFDELPRFLEGIRKKVFSPSSRIIDEKLGVFFIVRTVSNLSWSVITQFGDKSLKMWSSSSGTNWNSQITYRDTNTRILIKILLVLETRFDSSICRTNKRYKRSAFDIYSYITTQVF